MLETKCLTRRGMLLLRVSLLAVCSSPSNSGPSIRNVVVLGQQPATAEVPGMGLTDVNSAVVQSLYQAQINQSFVQSGDGTSSMGAINMGDVLDIVIWEAPPAVLFGGALSSTGSGNAQQTKLPEQMASFSGTISVPFIGDVFVLGKTPVQV